MELRRGGVERASDEPPRSDRSAHSARSASTGEQLAGSAARGCREGASAASAAGAASTSAAAAVATAAAVTRLDVRVEVFLEERSFLAAPRSGSSPGSSAPGDSLAAIVAGGEPLCTGSLTSSSSL